MDIITPYYGKNLCNVFANLIIEKFNSIDDNHKTKINVVNLNQFLIIKGKTSVSSPINYSNLFREYSINNLNLDKNFNVIDLIEYGSIMNLLPIMLHNHYDINDLSVCNYTDQSLQGFIKTDDQIKIVKYNNSKLFDEISKTIDLTKYDKYICKDNNIFVSDDFFGKNLNGEKLYEIFLNYISYNVFERLLWKDLTLFFHYNGEEFNDINWENIDFRVSSNTLITNKVDWLYSLILDLFDFDPKNIKSHLKLHDYNFECDLTNEKKCWEVRDKVKEIFLL